MTTANLAQGVWETNAHHLYKVHV